MRMRMCHPQRTFCTIGALYFSASHTLGLLLERLLDCIILLYRLLVVYLHWKLCGFCCTFLYLNSQPVLGILQTILKSLLPAQRECLHQGLLDLPAAYHISESLVEPFTCPLPLVRGSSTQMNSQDRRNM